ncbi:GNAT family N-acetyltransferase [Mycobacterium aquaticum]|uniref:GNAT family N-acetyltransferase n=1 Tax=Mycobacterium aquaticum TaxID=1927124 RepID=A0A1X0ACJ5_9MYCO|nr:GNAT family N-acetyltransferase [Mycobacterium aquaticum]ORA27781.1 GNAT family N-acetyltransferase [Mycobacterium aquaticum]
MAEVRNIPAAHHYEITVDGEHAGLEAYVDSGDQRIFYHTEIDDKFGGQGLAGELVSAALTDARAAGKRIVPVCPYVAKYVKQHHDFDDILDPVTPEAIAAVEAATHR